MHKKFRLIMALVIIAGALGLLISSGLKNNTGSYLTIKEALAVQNNSRSEYIQMEGNLAEGSTTWDPDNVILKFDLSDGQNKISISYNGVKPDNFDSGYPIIVEGRLDSNGTFAAESVKVRCPSKYEAEEAP
ncbi:MAG: cytochrome c maturation protein CcmE [Thermincola sp.]|nr:cytochrome c maturation protein CcmE [Thermincola sp.]MDT3703847.1 cytochrome c maturation protein CcmE [Thermincola sp.]